MTKKFGRAVLLGANQAINDVNLHLPRLLDKYARQDTGLVGTQILDNTGGIFYNLVICGGGKRLPNEPNIETPIGT